MEDKTLTCKDCGLPFIFSVRDQTFYAEKGFENEPQRCRDCRTARKTQRVAGGRAPRSPQPLPEPRAGEIAEGV